MWSIKSSSKSLICLVEKTWSVNRQTGKERKDQPTEAWKKHGFFKLFSSKYATDRVSDLGCHVEHIICLLPKRSYDITMNSDVGCHVEHMICLFPKRPYDITMNSSTSFSRLKAHFSFSSFCGLSSFLLRISSISKQHPR